MFHLLIEQEQVDKINGFDEKSRRITKEKLATLRENPYPGKRGDKEKLCLKDGYVLYRLHIGRTWTAFYRICEVDKTVRILDVMPIEQAHKKYGHFKSFSD
ncbi:type II toxin-antitoxin system RelE/ParE family toxin [uncultured Methanoregula sp.]|uniref:type II toxin-antitoxin system RelE/ParE family toxin n=1 Tax=uncultured Methanoregula sp. TaxID=1005933 RepID=UPI002AAB1EBB|nr:type II toxin-antitoxin system RelE/ParE family toxin [uncultured Methanoregula sp.]